MFHVIKHCSNILTKHSRLVWPRHISLSNIFQDKSAKEFYKLAFERLDLNRDGYITEEDLNWSLTLLGYGGGVVRLMGYDNKEHLVNSMMKNLDLNKKGSVDLESLVQFIENKCPTEEQVVKRFRDFDKDDDGRLSKMELRQSIVKSYNNRPIPDLVLEDIVEKQMRLYDKDKDGYISLNEYISAWYYLDVLGAVILKEDSTRSSS